MNIKGISRILQSGMEMVGELVKDKNQIKMEQARCDIEAQKGKNEVVIEAGKKAVQVGGEIISTTMSTFADNQRKKTDAYVEQVKTNNEIRKSVVDEELQEKRIRFNEEMEELAKDRDLQRRRNVLQAIQSYQIEVTKAVNESMLILASMPIEAKLKIENMLREEKERYAKLQSEWENDALEKLEKIEKTFANNERMRDKLQDSIWDEATRMIQMATDTVKRMEDDVKRINENAINFSVEGEKMVKNIIGTVQIDGEQQYYIENEEVK